MARIRTIKPEFFRHEVLQDLERANPGKNVMLVFAGLWGHCDRDGKFEWRPRMLKLDILPFLDFDMADTLEILRSAGLVKKYQAGGQDYGFIPTFADHQRITGKEAQDGAKFPDASPGNIGEAPGTHPDAQEGKGREGKGIGTSTPVDVSPVVPDHQNGSVPFQAITDLYNRTMIQLPKVRELTPKRKQLIRSAWLASSDRRSLKFWEAYFEECASDRFLNGTGPYKNGHENWRPSFDFLMRPDTITKTYEGAMHRIEQQGTH